MSQSNDNAS